MKGNKGSGGRFRFADFLVILLCFCGAAYSLNLFRRDLFQTISSNNEEAVGTIIIKNNIVQRRIADRVLWDRLFTESPVYSGDLIRVAELSDATLHIDANQIDLDENTLIRIQPSPDGGLLEIDLREGSLDFIAAGNIALTARGLRVEAEAGTVLQAAAGENGLSLRVSEGAALAGGDRLAAGTAFAIGADGGVLAEKAAVVSLPRPNARYLKTTQEPLPVKFAWNRVNLDSGEPLRLEISPARNFSRITQFVEGLDLEAEAAFDAGEWYWRLTEGDAAVGEGRITVLDASPPVLLSPVRDRLFRYQTTLPNLNFEWSEIENASYYILEAGETPDFENPRLKTETAAASFAASDLGPGTWYWRVTPVFPFVYEGASAAASPSSFRIESGEETEALVLPPPVVPLAISLREPAEGAVVAGLTALRQGTLFRWDTAVAADVASSANAGTAVDAASAANADAAPGTSPDAAPGAGAVLENSRFILSRNPDPFQGKPAVEIANPERTVRVDRLGEGLWYWTVAGGNAGGVPVEGTGVRQLRVLPIPLLPAPGNRQPLNAHRIGAEDLRTQRDIVFRWSPVQGANAYIFSLYEANDGPGRRIVQRPPENRTSWTLNDIGVLDRGTYVWRVEAVNRAGNGAIEQRGRAGENTFVLDVPLPGPVELEETGILYGN